MTSTAIEQQSAHRHVLVISSINRDMTFSVSKLPSPGETTLSTSLATSLGGKGANTAIAAKKAGAQVKFMGAIGPQRDALSQLQAYDVDVSHVTSLDDAETGQAVILLDDDKQNCIVVHPGANLSVSESVLNGLPSSLVSTAIVVLHLEIDHSVVQLVAKHAKEAGALVMFNPSPTPTTSSVLLSADATVWTHVDVLIVNEVELAQLSGSNQSIDTDHTTAEISLDDVRARVSLLCARHRVHTADVIVTMGARGALLVSHGMDHSFFVPAVRVDNVVDTTGAGDCLAGFVAGGLATGSSLQQALQTAVGAAALCVSVKGAAPSMPDLHDVRALLQ